MIHLKTFHDDKSIFKASIRAKLEASFFSGVNMITIRQPRFCFSMRGSYMLMLVDLRKMAFLPLCRQAFRRLQDAPAAARLLSVYPITMPSAEARYFVLAAFQARKTIIAIEYFSSISSRILAAHRRVGTQLRCYRDTQRERATFSAAIFGARRLRC